MNATNSNKSASKLRGASDFDPRNVLISGTPAPFNSPPIDFDSGIEVRKKGQHSRKPSKQVVSSSKQHSHKMSDYGPLQPNSLGIRDSDFDDDKHDDPNLLYRRRLDDSRNEQHNMSLYQEAQLEIEQQMRATTQATGATQQSSNGGAQEDEAMLRRESTFMGSAGEEEEERKKKELIKRFQEKPAKKR